MRASSSEDDDDSDTMFPTANEPAPSHLNPTLSHIIASPPASQDPPDLVGGTNSQDDAMDFAESANASTGGSVWDQQPKSSGVAGSAGGSERGPVKLGKGETEKEPGYAWNNKKARDEYARSMEQVVDKGFNLSESREP